MLKKLFLGFAVASLVAAPFLAYGATFKAGQSYYLQQGTAIDDNLYAAGSDVNLSGTVNGDVFVGGGNVNITGPINGELLIAGGTVNSNGNVSSNTRIAGGNINFSGSVNGELLVLGGQISVASGSSVAKDINIFGGTINFAGRAAQNLNIKGGTVYINGPVSGGLSITANEVKLGPNALIQGNFDYYSPKEVVLEQGAVVAGTTNFHKTELKEKTGAATKGLALGFLTFGWLLKMLMAVVVALILIYFFRNQTNTIVSASMASFWREVLRGLILLVVIPVVVILLFVTVIGVPIAFIVLLFYILTIILASTIAILLFARLALKYLFKKENYELNWWVIILAILAFSIISAIPILGWIFALCVFLSAFGATTNYLYQKVIS